MTSRYGLFVAILVGVGITGALWWHMNRAPNPNANERLLFEKLDFAISGNPPRAEDVLKVFGLDDSCARKSCFFESGQIGGLRYTGGQISPSNEGLIYVLEDLSGECIRVDRAERHFGTGQPEESCAHGGCWYRTAQHEWGIIAFGVKGPDAQCVSSVVINTEDYQRPQRDQ